MKVTITLGQKALEYVTGIPEEELPEILSDVLERSLAQQVRPIQPTKDISSVNNDMLMDKIMELMNKVDNSRTNTKAVSMKDDSTFSNKRDIIVETVESSASADGIGEDDDLFNLLK